MNNWKEIGIKLGLRNEKLTAMENQRLGKVQECCNDMLTYWLQFDLNASWEKIKEVVQSLSDIEPMVPTSDLMVDFKEYLYQRYSNMRVKNIVNTAFIYHQSKMATRESVEAVAKAMYYGNIVINGDQCSNLQLMIEPKQDTDYYAQCEKSTNILKLLTDLDSGPDREDPFLLLIEGAQGMGKTTTCKEIAFQWAKHRGLYGQFTFLICLHEINLGHITTFESFLEEIYHVKQSTVKNVAKDLQSSRGKKAMVIIDGYERLLDQQKYSVDSYIHRIINREIYELQQCDLVVSSCHTASVNLYQCSSCTRIELLGFTEKAKQQYIERTLNNDEKYIGELTAYLKEQSALYSLCYYPLCLCNLVHLFKDCKLHGTKLPKDQTEVINIIINRIVLSFSASQEKNFLPLTDAIGRMSKKHQLTLSTISKLAFYSLQTKGFVFKLRDIERGINSADARKYCLNGLGFLKIINSLENTDINQMLFVFLHTSLQEFLAAFYVSTLSQSNCAQIWEQTFWKSEFLNVWGYYCGITRDNLLKNMLLGNWSSWFGIQNLPEDILRNKIKCLYLVHCLMESPDDEIYQKVKPRVIANDASLNLSSCTFTQEDFQILIIFLSCCKVQQWSCLDLSCCHIDDDNLTYFLQQLQSFVTSIPGIKGLKLRNNQLSKICLRNVFKMAVIFNTVKINLSGNEIEDQKICENVTFFTQSSVDQSRINIIQNCESFFLLRCHSVLQDIKLISNLAHLYIIRCSLVNETIDDLLNALESCSTLSSVFFYDNTLLHLDLLKLLDGLKVLKWLKSVLIFEKTSLDVHLYTSSFKFILLSNNTALACHHQLAVLLQLNNYHIIDYVMSQIAVILNSSSQHWSLLDLSGSRIDDNTLRKFCNALYGNCAVDNIKLASNELSSSSLIVKLIQCLNPNAIDICGNSFATDDSNSTSVSMVVAEELFAHDKQLSLTLSCDSDIILFCQKLNLNAITAKLNTSSNFTQLFVDNCTLCSKTLLNSIDNYDTLTSLYLVHVQWSGDPFYNFTEFFEKNIFFSICENVIPRQTLGFLVSKFDVDVSRIISTNDIFIANKCSFNILKLHLIQKISPLSLNVNLFCILNCLLENEPQNSSIISDYLNKQNMVTEIMLCNNGLSPKNVCRIIKTLKQLKLLKSIFICELHKQLYGTKVAKRMLHIFNCSFIIIEDKVVIGNQASLEQLGQCLSLVSPSPTILRFISCSFGNEHSNTLVDVLSRNTTLEEFSLYECNTNDIWTKQLVEALQVKSAMTSLLLSCNKVTLLKADSIAIALSAVINSNPTLEKVSVKFDNLSSSTCGKIFQALSNIMHLKRFRFCDGQVTTKEAIDQLYKVIANNPSLEVVNLRNNKLRSSGIKVLAKAFKNICHLKLLALNGNQIDEEAADHIASIIANNVTIEKLLLYNNALKSGICKICQVLKCHKNLQVLRISQNYIQEEAADDIAEVINHNELLKVFDVANNRLSTNGVIKITRRLEKITTLQKLSLNENNITCTYNAAISIERVILNNLKLKVLHLGNNNFSVSDVSIIAKAVNKLTGLKELTVNNTGFTADYISTMITNNLLLEILDIGDNKLKSEGIIHISKALMKLSHLRVLGLYGNEITDDAADNIAEVISRLEKLWLSNNILGVVGMQTVCKSLKHNGTLKLLQLDNVGITEEVAGDIAAVINSNLLLEYIYLGNNKLHSPGANVILNSLKNKKQFKALALNNNCISEDVVDNVVQFVTSNPELEELLLNDNSIGTTGIINICRCIKDINTLRIFQLTGNNVSDEATDAFVSVIESNPALERISLDDNMLFNDKVSTIITKCSSLKCLQIICKPVTENTVYKFIDSIFAKSNIERISVNYLAEEMHFLSPLKAIDTVVVIKANVSESALHTPVLHSVVMKDKVEIVCAQDDELVKSEVMKLINVKTIKGIMLVFTRLNCYTDQEINTLATAIANYNNVNTLMIGKLNANKYNSDISGIVIIEGSEIMVLLIDDSLIKTRIIKLLNKIENLTNLILCTERMSSFTSQNINEIIDIISRITKLEKFTLSKNAIILKAMENVINCLTKTISVKTVKVLNNLSIRNFNFTQKSNKPASQYYVDEIEKKQWHKIFYALENCVNLKALDLSGNTINEEVAQYLSFLLDKTTIIEMLSMENCSIGMNLKYIALQKVNTLKHLDLSNNNLTDDKLLRTILENNTKLEKLYINENHFQPIVGDKLRIVMANLRNLELLSIDQNIISKNMTLELLTTFSWKRLFIYNHNYQGTEAMIVIGSLHNITTLTLCKHSVRKNNLIFSSILLKAGVVLSLWRQDNGLSRAGVIRLLSSFRKITTIKLLNISGNRLTDDEENTIASIIRENTQLENVMLGRCSYKSITDDFHTYVIECYIGNNSEPKHHKLHLSSKIVQPDKPTFLSLNLLFKIVSALRYNPNLRKLNLSGCPNNVISEELPQQLAIVLANSTKLETLMLEDCSLGNEGVNVIANSLKNVTTLKHLDLSNNNITKEVAIVNVFKNTTNLKELYLHKNCLRLSAGDNMSAAIVNLKNLEVLSIDQNIISRNMALQLANAFTTSAKLFIYNHDHQTTEEIEIRGSFNNINTLTLCKLFAVSEDQPMRTFILENGSAMLWWSQYNVLKNTTGVLRFLSSFKKITTIKLLNNSGSELTKPEVDAIATVISENVQLENVLLGSQIMKVLNDQLIQSMSNSRDGRSANELKSNEEELQSQFTHSASVSKDDHPVNQHRECAPFEPNFNIFHKLLPSILSALCCNIDLRTLDLSGNVITEELAEQLTIALANSTKLETLLLEDCSLGNEGVNVIANSLNNVTTLKHLDLSNNNITEEVVIVNVFKNTTNLKELHFHKNCLPFSAGDNMSAAIVNLKNLEELSIDQNIISRNMALQLADAFTTSAKLFIYNHDHQTTEVIEIRGSFNNINALTLRKIPTISEGQHMVTFILENGSAMLWWSQCNVLNTTGVLRFLSSRKKITTIKLLNDSGSKLTEAEVDAIATVISENVQLENVWLGSQSMKVINQHRECATFEPNLNIFHKLLPSILSALHCNTNLRALDLSGNIITEELAEQLANVLANSTKLETLLLRDCSLGNEGVNVIANSLNNVTTLKHLDLSNNNITEEVVIVNVFKNTTNLKELHFHKNCLPFSAGDNMSAAIVNLKNLEELSIDQNIISRNMALQLADAFTTSAKLFIYNHDHQTTEVIEIRGSFNNINALTLRKIPTISEGQLMVTFILENGSAMLWWSQCNVLNTTGVLRFLSSRKKITTIKLLNDSGSKLTEAEVDAIATVISENVQLENVWLGSQSMKVINQHRECATFEPNLNIFHKLLPSILSALHCNTNLRALDLSGNVITEELAEQLAILLANSTKLETLLLRDCSLGNKGVNVIANSLTNVTTLQQLWLSWNNITEVTADYIMAVLECNTGLEKVYLDGSLQPFNQFSVAIKKIKLKALMIDYKLIAYDITYELANSIINNSKLECLILKNYALQVTGILVFESLSANIKSLTVCKFKTNKITSQDPSTVMAFVEDSNIIVRCIQNNILASTGIMSIVSAFKGVTSVTLFNDTLDEYTNEDIDEILIPIVNFSELEELIMMGYSTKLQNHVLHSLSNCSLLRVDMSCRKIHTNTETKLASLLFNNRKLQKLCLNHCLLTSSQVAEIANALKTHTDIKSLRLHCNNITDVLNVADNIGQVLLKNQSMQKIYIGQNRLQAKGVIKILEVLKQLHNLNELSIGSNNITNSISDITDSEEIRLYDLLVGVITNNLNMEMLGIDEVCKRADGVTKVITALKTLSYLKILNISGNNINKEAADDFAMVITTNSNLTKLYIADNYLGATGTSIIARTLVSSRVLEVLDITNNSISVEAAESITEIIKNNPQLKVLLLGNNCLIKKKDDLNNEDQKLVLSNANSLSDILSTMNLSDVFINKQILEIKQNTKIYGPQYIFSYCIMKSGSFCCKLYSSNSVLDSSCLITFNKNILQSKGIKSVSQALATINSLEVLSIENNDVDDQAAGDIAIALVSNNRLQQLWIGQNHFTPSGISTILQSFLEKPRLSLLQLLFGTTPEDSAEPTLEVLDLSYSNLSQRTAVDISAVLSKNHNIQQLWLEGNNLSSQCITTITDALKKCTNISVLSLRDNNISEEVADVLSEALSKKCDLQQLYLGNNHLQDRGVIKITKALNTTEYLLTLDLMNNNISEAAADALASVITSCSQLEQLYLGDNKLQSTGTIKIARAIQQANCRSTLRVLDLSNNRIGSDETVSDEISRAVANTEVLSLLILDDNAFSVDEVWKIIRSLNQSAEYMMIFSVMRNDVVISEETKDEMKAVMPDFAMYL